MYTVYEHKNKINGKRYIGITKQKASDRWGNLGRNYKNSCPRFWSAIQCYGWDNFEHNILYTNLSKDDACALEIELIGKYKTQDRDYGYNILEGGQSPSLTYEIREKISSALIGNKNGLGKNCSPEKREKISAAQRGRCFTEEHKRNISLAKSGKSHAPVSADTRKKISDSHSKTPVICLDTNTVYPSIQQCSRDLHIPATSICAVCKGKHKTTSGLHFEYYHEH